jgi:hypothetical protein
VVAPVVPQLDLSTRPDILFQVFGERDDPRMIPIAALRGGKLVPIELSSGGWRRFDSMYFSAGESYTLYHDGMQAGTVKVRQGMWANPSAPVYELGKCEIVVPLATATVTGVPEASYTIEYFASSARMGKPVAGRSLLEPAEVAATAKQIGYALAKAEGIDSTALDSLDFRAVAVPTGATPRPTIITSFIDPTAGGSSESGSSHVMAIADAKESSARYTVTFDHVVKDAAVRAEYRRYVDHLDIDGNGVDEIILEGWQEAGKTYLLILTYQDGEWKESFRGRSSWCLDVKP